MITHIIMVFWYAIKMRRSSRVLMQITTNIPNRIGNIFNLNRSLFTLYCFIRIYAKVVNSINFMMPVLNT